MPALPTSTSSTCSCVDPRVQITFDVVNWDALSCLACKLYQVDSSHWGDRISGGYNLVRFLHRRRAFTLHSHVQSRSRLLTSSWSSGPIVSIKDGVLFKRAGGGEGKDAWYVEPSSVIEGPGDTNFESTISHSNAIDYWLARTNAQLHDICDANFGSAGKHFIHSFMWFMRSLIPSLFDPSSSIDSHGFPICPGDFHSQNITITDVDTYPHIAGVIDWEVSGPTFATTFAQYPLFIVDHPAWDESHPLRERNVRDQATFDELIRDPVPGLQLSHLISNGYGIYLFKQMIRSPVMFSALYPLLFAHIFGENENFSDQYYYALMEKGILKKDNERFDKEKQVWLEARKVLGEDLVDWNLRLGEFKDLVSKYLDRFDGGIVCEWMASVN